MKNTIKNRVTSGLIWFIFISIAGTICGILFIGNSAKELGTIMGISIIAGLLFGLKAMTEPAKGKFDDYTPDQADAYLNKMAELEAEEDFRKSRGDE